MRWKGRAGSQNVEDRRGDSGRSGGSGTGLLLFIASRFGIKGILIAVVGGFLLIQFGVLDPQAFLQSDGGGGSGSVQVSPQEQELFDFVSVVLAGTEEVWQEEFARRGATYRPPTLVVYRGKTRSACGSGDASMGPFYCSADEKIYIDLSFYHELARTFEAPGDFAQAYVIAHEVGHHVQHLLGTSRKVMARHGQPDYNQMSVRLELQADFLAGVWAHHSREYLEKGDIEEAMRAANAVGDDAIQMKAQGKIVPHAFTHGTSEQRTRWFEKGLYSGRIEDGDTFSIPYDQL